MVVVVAAAAAATVIDPSLSFVAFFGSGTGFDIGIVGCSSILIGGGIVIVRAEAIVVVG